MHDTPPSSPNQPPYDPDRYASYAPEPWDEQATPARVNHVWYGFIAFTAGMMLLGALLFLGGVMCQTNPEGVLRVQNESGMKPAFQNAQEIAAAAKIYYSLGAFYVLAGAIVFVIPHSIGRWIYGIVYIFLSSLTCFYAPFALVMLIFWLLPSTRLFFATPRH